MKLSHNRAVLLMVAVPLMWSIAGVVTRQLDHARSFEVTFWRSFFTALSLLVILPLWQGRGVFRAMPWGRAAFWVSGLCWSIMFTAFMLALTITTVANVLVTLAIGPLLTALIARLVMGQRIAPRTWGAILVAGLGVGYMYSSQIRLGETSALLGSLVALYVPVAGAMNWTVVQRSQAHGQKWDLVPSVLVGAVLSSLLTLPLSFPLTASTTDVSWLALLEIIFGILWAWLGAGETPSQQVLLGGALVIGALAVTELLGWRERSANIKISIQPPPGH